MLTKSLVIIDNFYNDVDDVRRIALGMEFGVAGNYPGRRTKPFINDNVKSAFENIIGLKILDWNSEYNSSFQFTTSRDRSWIHCDEYNNWGGVLYLTPNAPFSSGTAFYKHNVLGISKFTEESVLEPTGKDSQDMTKWTEIDRVGNVYNRLILFDAKRFHSSVDYFGDSLQNGRLFQTFFFTA